MAQTWVPTLRKRVMLAALDVAAQALRPAVLPTELSPPRSEDVSRILAIELWNIGDVVLLMPFLAQLRVIFPAARISLLGRPHARPLLAGTNLVDEYIETELGWTEGMVRLNPFAYRWRELRRLRAEMRSRDFDIAFKARMHIREHLLLALSGARRRVAFAFGVGDRVLTDPIAIGDPHRHKVEDWLRLLEPFGGAVDIPTPRLRVAPEEWTWATDYLRSNGVSADDRLVGIHPGASIPGKRWPLERFAAVASSLRRKEGIKLLAFVEPHGYGEALAEFPGVIRAKVGLRELIALTAQCDLLVGNDSGPMHIAAALGVPTVAIFGGGIARWFAPLGSGHRVVAADAESEKRHPRPEHNVEPFNISAVPVSRVVEAVDATLAQSASRSISR